MSSGNGLISKSSLQYCSINICFKYLVLINPFTCMPYSHLWQRHYLLSDSSFSLTFFFFQTWCWVIFLYTIISQSDALLYFNACYNSEDKEICRNGKFSNLQEVFSSKISLFFIIHAIIFSNKSGTMDFIFRDLHPFSGTDPPSLFFIIHAIIFSNKSGTMDFIFRDLLQWIVTRYLDLSHAIRATTHYCKEVNIRFPRLLQVNMLPNLPDYRSTQHKTQKIHLPILIEIRHKGRKC